MTNYEFLIERLDGFIRKYYVNQIIRGALWATGLVLGIWLIFSLLESQFYFDRIVRKIFFYSLLSTAAGSIWIWVLKPVLKFLRLGKRINHQQAAIIIGDHFGHVEDKLLNVLQLHNDLGRKTSGVSRSLIEASIEQKSQTLKPTPFNRAIDLSKNKKHLKWVIPPLIVMLGLFLIAPSLLTESTDRIIKNHKDFEREMPFTFVLQNNRLIVPQNQDFTIEMKVEGDVLPEEAFLRLNGIEYPMSKTEIGEYSYILRNLYKNTEFAFSANGFVSKDYRIEVIETPEIVDLEVRINVPRYTGLNNEILKNTGDLNVPEGSNIQWIFETKGSDQLIMTFDAQENKLKPSGEGRFVYSKSVKKSIAYQLMLKHTKYALEDSIAYNIQVIKDEYPRINLEIFEDSLNQAFVYFTGTLSDDYGLTKHMFNYEIRSESGNLKSIGSEEIRISKGSISAFEFLFDRSSYDLQAGDRLNYYFEVFDNDAVNGIKSAKSQLFSFKKPSTEELKEDIEKNQKEALDKMERRLDKSKEIQKKLKELREKLLQKKEASWQDKKDLEKLLEEQEKLEKQLEEAKKKLEDNLEKQKDLEPENEKRLQKQEELQKRLEEMMDDETKELMEKIRELMEELNKDEMLEMTEEMEMNEEEVEQEMERMMELYKQLDLENRLNQELEKLDKLAEKQEKLAEETEQDGTDEEKKNEQEEIKKDFEDIKNELDQIEKENQKLENKLPIGDMTKDEEEIEENMNEAQEQMEQMNSKKAAESQKKASKNMKKMSDTMKSGMQSGQAQQQQEDMETLRQIMENLVTISYEQEDLIGSVDIVATNTPKYVELVQVQNKLKDDFRIVEDSLIALSKRNAQIQQFVLEKVNDIQFNFESSKKSLEDRKVNDGQASQQRAMTYLNDLALMLSEAMNSMQQSMSQSMPGNQNCNKPGGAKPKPGGVPKDKISQGQKSLNNQMKDLMKKLENGGKVSSEEFAKTAAKQAALRRALKELEREKQQSGESAQELQELMDQMNKTEKELVNKRLTAEMLRRQEMIETRLLESEKAERQRGKDNKRQSEKGEDKNRQLPPELEEYLKQRREQIREYRRNTPELSPFFKKMVEEYYQSLQS